MIRVMSPHHSSRCGRHAQAVVMHNTAGGSARAAAFWFADKSSRVSSHFVIDRNGDLYQCVELGDAAWHCGVAELSIDGEMVNDANEVSIGIELANAGQLYRARGKWYYLIGEHMWPYRYKEPKEATLLYDNGLTIHGHWEPYPDVQIEALQELLYKLAATYPEAVKHLVGHEEIAMPMGRKRDPGPLFPWDRFSRITQRRTSKI